MWPCSCWAYHSRYSLSNMNRPCQPVYGTYVTTTLANWHETVEYKDTGKCEQSNRMFIVEQIHVDHYF